ncbi:MAG: signal recognition particle receptor subunit alpha [Chloroflexota bacterium]
MFKSIRDSLTRTRQSVFGQIASVLGAGDITDETWDDLEALLIQADVGVPTTLYIVDNLRDRVRAEGLITADQLLGALKEELRAILVDSPTFNLEEPRLLTVAMVVGVNGSGKTTSIGEAGELLQEAGSQGHAGCGRYISGGSN